MAHNLSFLCVASRVFAPVSNEEGDGAKEKLQQKAWFFVLMLILYSFLSSFSSSFPFQYLLPSYRTSTYTFVQKTALCVSPALCSQIDSVLGLSYRPARLQRLVGRYNNPIPVSNYMPQSGSMNLTGKNLCGDVARSTSLR